MSDQTPSRQTVWEVIQTCGAPDHLRDDFMCHWPECGEYRFQGYLGFGGKVHAQGDRVWVSCYRENETPERLELIRNANAALAAPVPSAPSGTGERADGRPNLDAQCERCGALPGDACWSICQSLPAPSGSEADEPGLSHSCMNPSACVVCLTTVTAPSSDEAGEREWQCVSTDPGWRCDRPTGMVGHIKCDWVDAAPPSPVTGDDRPWTAEVHDDVAGMAWVVFNHPDTEDSFTVDDLTDDEARSLAAQVNGVRRPAAPAVEVEPDPLAELLAEARLLLDKAAAPHGWRLGEMDAEEWSRRTAAWLAAADRGAPQ